MVGAADGGAHAKGKSSLLIKMKKTDVIIVGGGAVGTATAWRLARRGASVRVFDPHTLAHDKGSSHGETRLIRKAYFEHPSYVPLLETSYRLWQELEEKTGETVFHQTGLMMVGPSSSLVLKGVRRAADQYQIPIEAARGELLKKRLPSFQMQNDWEGLWEPTGGYLELEKAISLFAKEAERGGVSFHWGEAALSWAESAEGVKVKTARETYEAGSLVLAMGPWTPGAIKAFPLTVHRVPLFWFEAPKDFKVPCFAFDLVEGFFYGFPAMNGRVKIAFHEPLGVVKNPDNESREISADEFEPVKEFVETYLPQFRPEAVASALCFYTMTPDENFIVDRFPGAGRTFVACGLSGHGFKFSPVLGEVLADLATQGHTGHPIQFLQNRPFRRETTSS